LLHEFSDLLHLVRFCRAVAKRLQNQFLVQCRFAANVVAPYYVYVKTEILGVAGEFNKPQISVRSSAQQLLPELLPLPLGRSTSSPSILVETTIWVSIDKLNEQAGWAQLRACAIL
jgi:hypothetical protein